MNNEVDALISKKRDWLRTEIGWIKLEHIVQMWASETDDGWTIQGIDISKRMFGLRRVMETEAEAEEYLGWLVGVPREIEEEREDEQEDTQGKGP